MSGRILSEVTALLQDHAPQLLVDTLDRKGQDGQRTLLSMVGRIGVAQADGPQWQVRTSGRLAPKWYAETDAFKDAESVEYTQASLDFVYIQESVRITGRALDALSAGTYKVEDQLAREFADARESIKDAIETAMHSNDPDTGGDALKVTGLNAAIGDDTNTYANIDRTVKTSWKPTFKDNGGTPRALTLALMEETNDAIREDFRGDYNAILTSQTQLRNYMDLRNNATTGPQERIELPKDGGGFAVHFSPLEAFFMGVPIIPIVGFPTTLMYFVSTDLLRLEVIRDVRVSDAYRKNDDWFWDITMGLQMRHNNPHRNGSLIDLSA